MEIKLLQWSVSRYSPGVFCGPGQGHGQTAETKIEGSSGWGEFNEQDKSLKRRGWGIWVAQPVKGPARLLISAPVFISGS